DIINVASQTLGHGFFQNAGDTKRQGLEAAITYKSPLWGFYANYSYVDATYLTAITLSSPNNPFADANGNIFVQPGNHIPLIPQHRFKAGVEVYPVEGLTIGVDFNYVGPQWLAGDDANQNPQIPEYWVVNLHSSYKVTKNFEVFGLVQNLFNRHYYVGGTFFEPGQIPFLGLTDPRTMLPAAPLAMYAGIRAKY